MTRLARLAALLVVAVVTVACGSDSDEAGGTSTTRPAQTAASGGVAPGPARPTCELLSRDDVAKALGNAVAAGVPAGKDCFWGTDVDGGTNLNLTVDKPAPNQAASTCDLRKASISKENLEQIKDVGNSAVWSVQKPSLLTQGNLVACYDDAVVWVILTGEKEPGQLRSTATKLADAVRSRA